MRHVIVAAGFALLSATGMIGAGRVMAQAIPQTPATATPIPKTMSLVGCVTPGTDANTLLLTTKVGEVTAQHVLTAAEGVTLSDYVGHKVEATGTVIPAGRKETRNETQKETRSRGRGATTRQTSRTAETKSQEIYQLTVTAIKDLAPTCE
jgi:hypothetical protein